MRFRRSHFQLKMALNSRLSQLKTKSSGNPPKDGADFPFFSQDVVMVKNLSISLHDGADFSPFSVENDVTVGKFSNIPHDGADFPRFFS